MSLNSLGRAYCLWRLAKGLGWQVEVVAVEGQEVWEPLRGTEFEEHCRISTSLELRLAVQRNPPDLIIAVKPLPSSFGVALALRESFSVPILLDVDDPDLEWQLSWHAPFRRLVRGLLRRDYVKQLISLRGATKTVNKIVSNPELQRIYGGVVIPHVRDDVGPGADHVSWAPLVAFVGSGGRHKGVRELRQAISRLRSHDVKLLVTANPPKNAKPWEIWVGTTSWDEGKAIVSRADIVILPSRRGILGDYQLPAKLIDAMIAARAIAVSNVGPLPWALAGSGVIFRPSSVKAASNAILSLLNPATRAEMGLAARERALEFATVSACLPEFERAVQSAIRTGLTWRG